MKTVVNFGLIIVLLAIMTIPLVGSSVLITYNEPTEGLVAGARTISPRDVNILPNLTDFGQYVKFAPLDMRDNVYRDTLSLTVFQRQRASYRGVYSIYNLSERDSIAVEVVTSGVDLASDSFESLVGVLSSTGESLKLKTDLVAGATVVAVDDTGPFTVGEIAFVGDEMVTVVTTSKVGGQQLIITPLKRDHQAGEMLTGKAIVVNPGQLVYPQTAQMVLAPGERVQLDFEVQGTASLIKRDQLITLPIEIRVSRK